MIQIKVAEKIKTHILCSVPFLKNDTVYKIMSKNMVEPEATNDNKYGVCAIHAG